MSFSVILLPRRNPCFLTFRTRIPWRRRVAWTMASPAARISPLTFLPFLSTPSHRNVYSLAGAPAAAMCIPLFVGEGFHFRERGEAGLDLEQTRAAQVAHAFALCLVGDVVGGAVSHDDPAHFLADGHDLVNADPALVAGPLAQFAADMAVGLPAPIELLLGEAGAQQSLPGDFERLLAAAQPPD